MIRKGSFLGGDGAIGFGKFNGKKDKKSKGEQADVRIPIDPHVMPCPSRILQKHSPKQASAIKIFKVSHHHRIVPHTPHKTSSLLRAFTRARIS